MTNLYEVCSAKGTNMGSWFATSRSVAIARACTKGRKTSVKDKSIVDGWTAKVVDHEYWAH